MRRFSVALAVPILAVAVGGLASAQLAKDIPRSSTKEPTYEGKTLTEWAMQLASDDADARRRAEDAVRALTMHASAAPEILLAAATQPGNRSLAQARILVDLGPRAVPALVAGLWSTDDRARRLCLLLIARIGAEARIAGPSLVRLLSDPDEEIRRSAAGCLWEVGADYAIPALAKALVDRAASVRLVAADSLIRFGTDPKPIVAVLTEFLKSERSEEIASAVALLGMLGPEADVAVPALAALVPRDDPELTIRLASALGSVGSAAREAVPVLKKRLADDKHGGHEIGLDIAIALWRIARDPDAARILREHVAVSARPQQAAEALWRIDSSEETIKALTARLKSEKPEIAIAAAGVLGAKAKDAVPLLGRMLAHTEPNVRARAVVALVRLGPDASGALEPLRGAVKDDSPTIAFWAAVAVCRLDPKPDAIAAMAGYLDHREPELRRGAAEVLGQLREKATTASPRLTTARADEDGHVRLAAAMAAWKSTSDFAALQSAADLLKSPDAQVRSLSAVDIGAIVGPSAKPILPNLVMRLFDSHSSVRSSAAEALGRIGPTAADAAPALLTHLEGDELFFVQSAACEALGLIQPADKDAVVDVLRKKLNHSDPLTRIHAALALWQLAGDRSGEKEAERGLAHRTHQVRITAAEILWRMKQDNRVVPFLMRTLEDSNLDGRSTDNERYMAARLAGRIGPAAKAAVPELRKLLNHSDAVLASTAAEAIRVIEAGGKK